MREAYTFEEWNNGTHAGREEYARRASHIIKRSLGFILNVGQSLKDFELSQKVLCFRKITLARVLKNGLGGLPLWRSG